MTWLLQGPGRAAIVRATKAETLANEVSKLAERLFQAAKERLA